MDFDKLGAIFLSEFKGKEIFENFKKGQVSFADLEKEIKKYKSVLIKKVESMKKDKDIYGSKFYDSFVEENKQRKDNNEEELELPKKFTRKEIKERQKLFKKAFNISSKAISNKTCKDVAFDATGASETLADRGLITFFSSMCKDEKEAFEIGNKIQNLNEGNNKEDIKQFVIKGIERAKKACLDILEIRTNDQLFDFMEKDFSVFETLAEFQRDYIDSFNNKLNLGIDNDILTDWKQNYSEFAVDAVTQRAKLLIMANPLFPELDVNDTKKVLYADFNYGKSFWLKNSVTKFDNLYLNPFDSYDKNGGLIQLIKLTDIKNNPYKASIKLKLHSLNLSTDLSKYTYLDKNGNKLALDDAFKKVTDGESINMMHKSSFVTKLEISKDIATNITIPTSDITKLKFVEAFKENNSKDKKMFDDLNKAKEALINETNTKNKDKLQKNVVSLISNVEKARVKNISNVEKQFDKSLKELYSKVKSNNPWYIKKKGNKIYTRVQNELSDLIGNKKLTLEEKIQKAIEIRNDAQQYLSERAFSDNKKTSKHALDREEAMLQIFDSLRPVEKEFNNVKKENEKYANVIAQTILEKNPEVEKKKVSSKENTRTQIVVDINEKEPEIKVNEINNEPSKDIIKEKEF